MDVEVGQGGVNGCLDECEGAGWEMSNEMAVCVCLSVFGALGGSASLGYACGFDLTPLRLLWHLCSYGYEDRFSGYINLTGWVVVGAVVLFLFACTTPLPRVMIRGYAVTCYPAITMFNL